MSEIINKISSFFHFIQEGIELIKELFVSIIGILSGAFNYLKMILSVLPANIYIIVCILLVVCIVYLFLGRQGNG